MLGVRIGNDVGGWCGEFQLWRNYIGTRVYWYTAQTALRQGCTAGRLGPYSRGFPRKSLTNSSFRSLQ
jgi:hypothetical protein